MGRAWGALAVLTVVAAALIAGCGGSGLPERASPDEEAACARLVDIDHDRQIVDVEKLRADLEAAVQHADRSRNGELQRLLHRVEDDYEWLEDHGTADDESMTVILRTGAYLTLARVECRERGLLLNSL